MQIHFVNTWLDTDLELFVVSVHNCGHCQGFELFLLGFGIVVKW